MIFILLAVTALLLAYANGANDNLKSFSTLWGSGAMSYRSARHWATMATVAGAIAAVFLAQGLVASFSGRGLVPDNLAGAPAFLVCVAFGAGGTVLIATWSGLPISTTHALIGALVGAGLAAPGHSVTWDKLGSSFLLPLLLSPVLSSVLVWSALQFTRRWAPVGIPGKADKEANDAMCACIDAPVTATAGGTLAMFHATVAIPVVIVGGAADCAAAGATPLARWQAGALLKHTHFVSGLAICFARAVNDTPKLAALLAAAHLGGVDNGPEATFGAIALGMATGGWLSARKVAETMATKITPLSEAQGATANLVTACLVIAASKFGLPVSTTHVSVGAISGAGAANGSIETAALTKILWSWAATLPLGGALAMAAGLIVF